MQKKYTFYINGMHCKSCSLYISNTLKNDPRIESAHIKFDQSRVQVVGNFENLNDEQIIESLNNIIDNKKYHLSLNSDSKSNLKINDTFFGIFFGILVLTFFVLIQKAGIVNLINIDKLSFLNAFIIGVIASFSSCLAVVGSISLALGITSNKKDLIKTQSAFQIGRLASFLIFGGLLGVIGSTINIDFSFTAIINLLIGVLMLFIGINSLGLTKIFRKFQISIPEKAFEKITARYFGKKNYFAALIIGAATFIMPCGFTQSLQVFSLTTGSFVLSSLIMFAFALGTLPVLTLVGLGFSSLTKGKLSTIFNTAASTILIGFSLLTIISSMSALYIIRPILNL